MTVRIGKIDGKFVGVDGSRFVPIRTTGPNGAPLCGVCLAVKLDQVYEELSATDFSEGSSYFYSDLELIFESPRQIFAIGLNYGAHRSEAGYERVGDPQVFTKFQSSLAGPNDLVRVHTSKVDWEVELVTVISRTAVNVSLDRASDYVGGYLVGQDISARDLQLQGSAPQWSLGKSFSRFGPIGPTFTFAQELNDPTDLAISAMVNGVEVQSARTSSMIWNQFELIEYLSKVVTLYPGDIIFTGTPAGVGNRMTPPQYLKPGDVIESSVEGLDTLVTKFIE